MPEYLLLMHNDADPEKPAGRWEDYLRCLRDAGRFQGGSAIGSGICARKTGSPPTITRQLSGYIRVMADNLDEAQELLAGNPVFESGGTVELRELTED